METKDDAAGAAGGLEFAGRCPSWGELLDGAGSKGPLEEACRRLVAEAEQAAAKEIIRRVHRYEDIGKHRTWLDGRAAVREGRAPETFALSMTDHKACWTLAEELPLLAAAWRLTRREALLGRVMSQLEEFSTWRPIQRPGWSLCGAGGRREKVRDGNWLATGCGIRAIAESLEILPTSAVSPGLRGRIEEQLAAEIAGVVDDWRCRRPWFVRGDNPQTNQWVLPNEGLVRACLVLGRRRFPEAYELGVSNLLRSMGAYGPRGEFPEGLDYASFTVLSLLHAARAAAADGDRRLIDHPFLREFPTWMVHHLQPGLQAINCFDAFGASARRRDQGNALLAYLAAWTGSPVARWAMATQYDAPPPGLAGVLAAAVERAGPGDAPPTFAAYEMACRVNWRSSWSEDASGVWVRGGHRTDQHDHRDRGHVSLVLRGRPVLIEAGTPCYHHPEFHRLFSSGVGHNVLQLGLEMPSRKELPPGSAVVPGWQRLRVVAPIEVRRLDAAGGEVRVDGSTACEGLRRWHRVVRWDADALAVRDEVELAEVSEQPVLFRWHLAAQSPVRIEGAGTRFRADWDGIDVTLEGSRPIEVSQEMLPDWTLHARDWDDPSPDPLHACLIVRTPTAVSDVTLTTTVTAGPDKTPG